MFLRTQLVIYTTDDGFREIRKVPEGIPVSEYNTGIFIGPPDLSDLKVNKNDLRKINNMLVDHQWISLPNLNGKRAELLRQLENLGHVPDKARKLRSAIIRIYQIDYYPELTRE